MKRLQYPNLELLEYMFKQELSKDKDFTDKIREVKEKNRHAIIDICATVFPQWWGATNTAFDETPTGEPTMGGCAMTEAYTVVFHERLTDIYAVFVDDRPCYLVKNATQRFYDDLAEKRMASYSQAKKLY